MALAVLAGQVPSRAYGHVNAHSPTSPTSSTSPTTYSMPREPSQRSAHHAHHHPHYQQSYPPQPPPLSIQQTMTSATGGPPPLMNSFSVQQSPASAIAPNGASGSPLPSPLLSRSDHQNPNGNTMAPPPPPSSSSSSPTSPQSSLASPTAPPSSATSVSSAGSANVSNANSADGKSGSPTVSAAGTTPTPPGQKKKHVCPTCERAFTTSGHLARHTRVHTGERNHKCPFPGCETRCSRQDNLQQHYRIHLSPGSRRSSSNSTRAAISRAMGTPGSGVSNASANAALAAAQAAQMGMSVPPLAPPPLAHAHVHQVAPTPPPNAPPPLAHAHTGVFVSPPQPPTPDAPPPLGGPGSATMQQPPAMRSSVERSPDLARFPHTTTSAITQNGGGFYSSGGSPSAGNSPVLPSHGHGQAPHHPHQQQPQQHQQQVPHHQSQFTFAPQNQVPPPSSMYPPQHQHQHQQAYNNYNIQAQQLGNGTFQPGPPSQVGGRLPRHSIASSSGSSPSPDSIGAPRELEGMDIDQRQQHHAQHPQQHYPQHQPPRGPIGHPHQHAHNQQQHPSLMQHHPQHPQQQHGPHAQQQQFMSNEGPARYSPPPVLAPIRGHPSKERGSLANPYPPSAVGAGGRYA